MFWPACRWSTGKRRLTTACGSWGGLAVRSRKTARHTPNLTTVIPCGRHCRIRSIKCRSTAVPNWRPGGEHGSSIEPRLLADDLLPSLRFGYPKSKEKGLLFNAKGEVVITCLCATRRLTPETQEVFEALFQKA